MTTSPKHVPPPRPDADTSAVGFVNARFDPALSPFEDFARALAAGYGYTAELNLDPELAQLLRLRVAQLGRCPYCLTLHAPLARERAGTERTDGLEAWRRSDLYSPAERAALAYCEVLVAGDGPGMEEAHADLARHLPEADVAEVAGLVINMIVWTRWKLAQGSTPTTTEPTG